jgi:hypothetical protein
MRTIAGNVGAVGRALQIKLRVHELSSVGRRGVTDERTGEGSGRASLRPTFLLRRRMRRIRCRGVTLASRSKIAV